MLRTRILGPCITAALTLPLSAALRAQMHHVDKPQHVTRAVGVYEWTGDLTKPDAARLIPVSLYMDGHFQDAGVFMAQPIPLALETGNVYSIQRAGDIIGTLDLDYARDVVDRRSTADDNPLGAWYGYGRFLPLSTQAAPSDLVQHSATPAVIVGSDDDSRPHFVAPRHPNDDNSTTTAKNNTPAPPDAGVPGGRSSSAGVEDDPDRPHMSKRDSDASADNAPASLGTKDIEDDPDRPTLGRRDQEKKEKKKKESGSGVEPMPTSLNEDPDRPELHRGKVESATAPPQLTGVPANLHQAVAVSDAANNPPHVFAREWDSSMERAQTMAAMQKLAEPIARQYLATNHLEPGPSSTGPKLDTTPGAPSSRAQHAKVGSTTPGAPPSTRTGPPAGSHAGAGSGRVGSKTHASAASTPLAFTDEQITGYTLSYGGLPTFVYSAAVPTTAGPPVRVTVVAQRLPSGELQISLKSVTDENHLDRTPWMRLVDAVDPDDSHRASLLFELRARSSRQFALYSLATADAQQTFVTGLIE
ncbi:MAG TPA: hypothetical protein VFA99_15755 [Acidobacteriaceae bacterium]|nr:hypothetical protein [Acidobacteriaceae bacterium]